MKKSSHQNQRLLGKLIAMLALLLPASVWAASSNFTYQASVSLKETWDSNIYLQDVAPDPTVAGAVPAKKDSLVTTITPSVGVTYKACSAFQAGLTYEPEVAFYHAAHSEDYVRHLGRLNFQGSVGSVPWQQANTFVGIDGTREGLIFGGPGGAPAIGGVPLRNRRAQFVYKGSFNATIDLGPKFFLRPNASAYVHDFLTVQRAVRGYENYQDRTEVLGGLDVGYRLTDTTRCYVGYRYGYQYEGELITSNFRHDNQVQRVLFGVEGNPASWITLGIQLGPDFRDFTLRPNPRLKDPHEVVYVNSFITLRPTANDQIKLTMIRYEQPAFASASMYEDITYDVTWQHKFSDHVAAMAGFRAYIGDWRAPVAREDWIYTPSIQLSYLFNKHLAVQAAYSYDWAESAVSNTAGREFTRHLVSVMARYNF